MITTTALATVVLSLALAPQDIARGPLGLHYEVRATDAAGQDGVIPLQVALRVEHPPRPRAVFQLPVWAPGSYRLRDFPDRIHDLQASAEGGEELPVLRLDRHTWQVAHGDQRALTLRYRVDLGANDRFMMRGDRRRCITYEGPAVYLYLRGHKTSPCRIRFALPEGWSVASGLVDAGDGSYFAQDYDFLADCPVKMGVFQRFGFVSHGVPIDVVVDGPGDVEFDHETWLGNIKKITDEQGELFGGFPFDRYTFLYTVSPRGGGGGLEHLTSTAIGLSAQGLRRDPQTGMGVTAHEFFHLWNVKRVRPRSLGPFDYTKPVRTTTLWLMEGVTSYYTDVTLARCGLRTPEQFWASMARQIQAFESSPARPHVSSAMASERVWDDDPRDRSLNYYNSGLVLGLLLDVEIRARSRNRHGLDDLMRGLYRLCRDRGRGFDDGELVTLASDLAGSDLGEWFDRYVYGTVERPYAEMLKQTGMLYREDRSTAVSLRGLLRSRPDAQPLWADPDAAGARALQRSGRVRKLGDTRVDDLAALQGLVEQQAPGSTVRLELEGLGGGTRVVEARVVESARVRVTLEPDPAAGAVAHAIREAITK